MRNCSEFDDDDVEWVSKLIHFSKVWSLSKVANICEHHPHTMDHVKERLWYLSKNF
jgi:hypothetical protein